jgi:hypothetical protein
MSEFRVRNIPVALVERFWPYAEPYIKRALDHTSGEFLPEDIRSFALQGIIQLWLVSEGNRIVGAVTTETVLYPKRKHCRIITLAGSQAAEWTHLVDTIVADWAKTEGCDAVEAFVRKGYVPTLTKLGFKFKYCAIVKDI